MSITKEEVEKFLSNNVLPFKPGQTKLSLPILQRIHQRVQLDYKFNPVKVDEDRLIDGHHRFICFAILGKQIESIVGGRNNTQNIECSWQEVTREEIDYDSTTDKKQHEKDFPTNT